MMTAEVKRHCLIITPVHVQVSGIKEETDLQVVLFAHTAAGEGMGFPGYKLDRSEDGTSATVLIYRD